MIEKNNYSWIVDHQNGSIFNLKKMKKSDNDEKHYSFRTNNLFLDKLQGKAVGKKQEKISYTYVLMGRHHLCYRWLDWGNRDLGNERTGWILEIEGEKKLREQRMTVKCMYIVWEKKERQKERKKEIQGWKK